MIERGKSLLNLRTDASHGNDERQAEVADDGASQQAAAIVVAMDIGRHVDGDVGGPRHSTEERVETRPHLSTGVYRCDKFSS